MPKDLKEYNRKRDFGKTGEPKGTSQGNRQDKQEPLRFVVQHHIARRDHFDFRLEWGEALLSWAVPKGPSYNTHDKRLAVQVEDHPLEYRNFEGTIPKGEYGGGVVMLWDEGYWEPLYDVDEGLGKGSLKFTLKGRRLKGNWALVRLKAKADGNGRGHGSAKTGGPGKNRMAKESAETENNWLLLKEKDSYAKPVDGISEFTTSIRTGRTMAEIEEGAAEKSSSARNPFRKTDVQLAKLVSSVPEGEEWIYELKYDGYRILAYLEDNDARLISRNGNDYTRQFQDVADSLLDWAAGRAMVLDGEMVIADAAGRTDFQALQSYIKNPKGKNLIYIVFDLLALDGEDLRKMPLIERKETLESLMKNSPKNLYYGKHVEGNGKASFLAACEANMEGVVGKKADSVYSGTRSGDWIKLKCDTRQEFVIGGYALSDKKASGVSSLLLGVYEGEDLLYAGRAGTGLAVRDQKELEGKFGGVMREETPFKKAPEQKKNEIIFWLEPVLVAEIKFAEWTAENLLRQASFKGLRTDKAPGDIRRESIRDEAEGMEKALGGNRTEGKPTKKKEQEKAERPEKEKGNGKSILIDGIRITSPDKVIFEDPVIKKADVVRYYAQVSERMLPYVGNRILSIVRCPKGIAEACFFKKHPGPDCKGIVTIPIRTGSGETEEYFYIETAQGLLSEAQMGTLEFHTWGSRADELEKPDMMVFDLDPDEGMELEQVRQGVRDTRSLLDQLSLVSYLKTSGGKGYHVVVPLKPSVGWEVFHGFARRIAELMEQKWPDRYTSNVRKDKRKGRIFIDWIRNGRGATSIAPYSIRARKGAPVSMPILWEELDTVAPDGVNMEDALTRIKSGDPWKDFYRIEQCLK